MYKDNITIIQILLTHGYCHLLGYKHDTTEQYQRMYARELNVLDQYNKITGSCLRPITQITH